MEEEQIVNPWKVQSKSGINYKKLIEHFGCNPIDGEIIKRFECVTKMKAHKWLRRGLFFSHKDFTKCIDDFEKGKQIYLYTGRGPSGDMHFGHLLPFIFTKYLQDAFNAIVIIQMSDDEKYLFKGGDLESYINLTFDNAKDIIACGFDVNKTYIFSNANAIDTYLYHNIVKIDGSLSGNNINSIFGLDASRKVGEIAWPSKQIAPAYSNSFPDILFPLCKYTTRIDKTKKYDGKDINNMLCLVPMAIDQSPYFRVSRDIAEKFGYMKPCEIHSEFLPSLGGIAEKMSTTSGSYPPIYLNDTLETMKKKIDKSFSGGKDTKELHQLYGGNLHIDVAYQYLLYFEEDDKILSEIAHKYRSGKMLTGDIKKKLFNVMTNILENHKKSRENISDDVLCRFFDRSRNFIIKPINRKDIELSTNDEYSKMGINFDRTYGAIYPDGAQEYEQNLIDKM